MVWRPELQQHANGATALGAIIGVTDDPRTTAETYAGFYAQGRIEIAEGGFRVETGQHSADLLFLDLQATQALWPGQPLAKTSTNSFVGLRVRVKNSERVREVLDRNGVRYSETAGGGIAVGTQYASGAVIEFVPA